MKYSSPNFLTLFKDEIIELNNYIDSSYNINTAPRIKIFNNLIKMPDSRVGVTDTVRIQVFNIGDKQLEIYEIETSCSCVKKNKYNKYIEGGKSEILEFYFTPDVTGIVEREIIIISNSIVIPIYYITISANVN